MPAPQPASTKIPAHLVSSKLPIVVWMYLISVIVPIGFDVGNLSISLMRALLMITLIPTAIGLFSGRYGKTMPVDYLFVLYILWATVCVAISTPSRAIENVGSIGVEFLGGYFLARAYIRSADDFVALIKVLLLIIIISLPLALFESLTDDPILIRTIYDAGLGKVGEVHMVPRMGLFRAQVFFAHPIHYGLFCSVAFSLIFVGMKGLYSGAKRWISSALIAFCVFLSLSSGAILAIVIQCAVILWAFIFRKIPGRWILLLGLMALMYVVVDLLSNRTPIRVFMTYATFSAHNAFWRNTIFEWGMINVWNHPIFGIGLGGWIRPSYMRSASVDNFWLLTLMKFGFPGFLFLALGYVNAVYRVGRRKFAEHSGISQLRLAWMFLFVGMSFTLSTVAVWTAIYSFVFFLLGSGLWLATANSDEMVKTTDDKPTNKVRPSAVRGADIARDPERQPLAYTRFPSKD
jgi:O-antigen ligase